MIDTCPECDSPLAKGRCECGYTAKPYAKALQRARCAAPGCTQDACGTYRVRGIAYPYCYRHMDERHSDYVARWLASRHIIGPDMQTGERMKACAEYRSALSSQTPRKGIAWAHDVLRRAERVPMPPYALELAREAIKRAVDHDE